MFLAAAARARLIAARRSAGIIALHTAGIQLPAQPVSELSHSVMGVRINLDIALAEEIRIGRCSFRVPLPVSRTSAVAELLPCTGAAFVRKSRLHSVKSCIVRMGQHVGDGIAPRVAELPGVVDEEIARIRIPVLLQDQACRARRTMDAELRFPVHINTEHIIKKTDRNVRMSVVIPHVKHIAQKIAVLPRRNFINARAVHLLRAKIHAGDELDEIEIVLAIKRQQFLGVAYISLMDDRQYIRAC